MTKAKTAAAGSEQIDQAIFDLSNRLYFRLYQASNLLHKNGTRFMSAFGTTTQQWAVLGALARPRSHQRGMTVKELLEFLSVSRQNLTPVIDRLEARGWVERVKDPDDGRSRRIRLTPLGDATWDRMLVRIDEFYNRSLAGFSMEEKLALYRLLDRLKLGLEEV
ncbi:MarR family winged helix-turn-helix transcriptional regulator [Zavarzinia compransoris]|uniref:Transcriptional regulator n=1 Tax=Zavarzinia compransoris TaxID=1264899 RepID=A0A317E440_9PROT|nr:MarR family transcriptional regulator [Zavarzinia compransoris]PWR20980.1 transcriptional regulator [Zavarzinia compransoris]TDP44010.1 MarR family transcriptional regulator [Zavarzinia compransoris]